MFKSLIKLFRVNKFRLTEQIIDSAENEDFPQLIFDNLCELVGDYTHEFKIIGANRFSDLATRANTTYKLEYEKITAHQDGTLEGFSKSYENNPLDVYDDEFYELYKEENLNDLQIKYIRLHKSDFFN